MWIRNCEGDMINLGMAQCVSIVTRMSKAHRVGRCQTAMEYANSDSMPGDYDVVALFGEDQEEYVAVGVSHDRALTLTRSLSLKMGAIQVVDGVAFSPGGAQ